MSEYQWSSASLTHVGNVRRVNEDACLEMPWKGVWAVADGMGGHDAGDVASQMVVKSLGSVDTHARPAGMLDDVEDRLLDINARLYEMGHSNGEKRTIGTTVVSMLAFSGFGLLVWAGDSRAYRLRGGALAQMTRDHSEVEELIEQGVILREDAETHPLANVITRAVGGAQDLSIDVEVVELRDGDRFLLCSDGLYKDLNNDDITTCLGEESCHDACRALIKTVLDREAADNVTVAVVDFSVTD